MPSSFARKLQGLADALVALSDSEEDPEWEEVAAVEAEEKLDKKAASASSDKAAGSGPRPRPRERALATDCQARVTVWRLPNPLPLKLLTVLTSGPT